MTAVLLAALHDLLTVPESLVTAGRGRPARHHRAQLRQHRRRGGGPVDATSGYWAERDQSLNDGDNFTHYVKQAVVLFPTVEKAGAFFDAAAKQWPACRQYTHTQSESQWSVGPISNANGTLSTTAIQQNASAPGWGCGRALALRNNVIIDINTCNAYPADSPLKIADQIAAKVTAR